MTILNQNERISVTFDDAEDNDQNFSSTELGESLIAIEKTFSRAYSLLYPDRGELRLTPSATREGSFEIELVLRLFQESVEFHLLATGALSEIRSVVDAVTGDRGAVRALKWLKQRVAQFHYNADDTVTISTEHEEFTATGKAVHLIQNDEWRKGLVQISNAIAGDKSYTKIDDKRNEPLVIERSDQDAFAPPEEEHGETITKHRDTLTIVAPSFDSEVEWWLRNQALGLQQFAMQDSEFQHRAETQLRFSGNDRIECTMTITDRGPGKRPRIKYAILDVIRYTPARHTPPRQGTLLDD